MMGTRRRPPAAGIRRERLYVADRRQADMPGFNAGGAVGEDRHSLDSAAAVGRTYCSGSPALPRPSATAGAFEARLDINLTVSSGLSLRASATAGFASSARFVIA